MSRVIIDLRTMILERMSGLDRRLETIRSASEKQAEKVMLLMERSRYTSYFSPQISPIGSPSPLALPAHANSRCTDGDNAAANNDAVVAAAEAPASTVTTKRARPVTTL